MTTDLIPFSFQNISVRALLDKESLPWFIVKDICEALDISNTAVKRFGLDNSEIQNMYIPELTNNFTVVNESGLYTLVIRSSKPKAREFRQWVTGEVLPALRKTGSYTLPGAAIAPTEPPANDLPISFTRLADELDGALRIASTLFPDHNQALLSANGAIRRVYAVDTLELFGSQKLIAPVQEPYFTATELGNQIGKTAIAMNLLLKDAGLQEQMPPDAKGRKPWVATDAGRQYSVLIDTGKKSGGKPVQQLCWYASVIDHIGVIDHSNHQ